MTEGQVADASDREYFVRGFEGESGVCAVDNSLFYDDLSVVFYTPLFFEGDVVGVICGRLPGRLHGEVPAHLHFR